MAPPRLSTASRALSKSGSSGHGAQKPNQKARFFILCFSILIRKGSIGKPSKRIKTAKPVNKPPIERLQVFIFGSGESGELGLGAKMLNGRTPESAELPRQNHNLDPDTVVLTWGVNDSHALGRDTTWKIPDDTPDGMTDLNPMESSSAAVAGLSNVGSAIVQVAACDNASFVLTAAGDVYGWGTFFVSFNINDFKYLLPNSDHLFQRTPMQISGLKDIKELATGVNHVLALTHGGNVYFWGSGHQLEPGRRLVPRHESEALVPRLVALPKNKIRQVFAGLHHNFAIDVQGLVWTWGLINFGQAIGLSDEENLHVGMPIIMDELRKFKMRHIAGGFHHSLACTDAGDILAWGRCDDSQLGVDMSAVPKENVLLDGRGRPRVVQVPTTVPNVKGHFVAAGIDNSFAIDQSGNVVAWGFSDNFRTGLRTEDSVEQLTMLRSKAIKGVTFSFVGCGGQFSVIAGQAGHDASA
ncbi:regulator of chromosome condensation 1/beta-lactamase-inhibitor protein II [Trichoderma austrokoningii]